MFVVQNSSRKKESEERQFVIRYCNSKKWMLKGKSLNNKTAKERERGKVT